MLAANLYVIGDSISMQYGPYLKEMSKPWFQYDRKGGERQHEENLDYPMLANGGDSRMVLAFMKQCELDKPWKQGTYLLLNCGLHDIKRDPATNTIQVDVEEYETNLLEIIQIAVQSGLHPVWVRSTPVVDRIHNSRSSAFYRYNTDLVAYNEAADRIMLQGHVPVIDLYTFTNQLGEDERYCDHVHFSEHVRRLQAAYIAGSLCQLHKATI